MRTGRCSWSHSTRSPVVKRRQTRNFRGPWRTTEVMANTHYSTNRPPLQPEAFTRLPLGAVAPRGWLRDQCRIQAEGLTGHLEEFWPDLGPDNKWLGGHIEG